MNVGVISLSSKKQNICKDRGIDIISNLPKYVLHHILSFLSTKDVIRLSVLSRRWQYVWTAIPNIDLENSSAWIGREITGSSFLEFVNRVLTLHDCSDIKRLGLWMGVPKKFSWLNLWISIAVNHNVEELDLYLHEKAQCALPCWLFTCHSLIVLNIIARLTFNSPPCTWFLNLKKLHLQGVTFQDDVSTDRLFSSCPVLHELALICYNWKHIEYVTISIPSLKSLRMETFEKSTKAAFGCMINISCVNLTDLSCLSDLKVVIRLCKLPSLDSASVEISKPGVLTYDYACYAQELFSGIDSVQVLRITSNVLLCITYRSIFLTHIPTFCKLARLEVRLEEFPCYNELMKMLKKAPNLKHLDLYESTVGGFEGFHEMEMVPSCFNHALKIFRISFFEGTLNVMELLGFVLKNATVLQSMIIHCFSDLSQEKKQEVNKFPKASKNCVIEWREHPFSFS